MLHDKLKELTRFPFHMPGHKRNPKFNIAASELDITEIEGFDNLHSPNGVIAEIESSLADIYGAEKSFLLVNGSTVGILAAIHAVCKRGDTIIIARNCHKSVFNACLLLELEVAYIEPEFDGVHGFYTRVSQTAADAAVKAHPEAKAIVITSPTYEGYISKIKADIPLIIDAAPRGSSGVWRLPRLSAGRHRHFKPAQNPASADSDGGCKRLLTPILLIKLSFILIFLKQALQATC
jgi:arginine/lysine/ornithine decarboxylase